MNPSHQNVSQAIVARDAQLATAIVDRQGALYPDRDTTYGAAGHAKCVQDVQYTLSFLAAAIAAGYLVSWALQRRV